MRKFRGKRVDNGEWAYGCLFQVNNVAYILLVFPTEKYGSGWSMTNGKSLKINTAFRVIPETVGQFLRKDKNGKDIFAKAPIRYAGEDYPKGFMWDESGLRWELNDGYFHTHYGATGTGGEDDYFDLEVISDVHDNPELKVKND